VNSGVPVSTLRASAELNHQLDVMARALCGAHPGRGRHEGSDSTEDGESGVAARHQL
jgi:hypothetical protein